MNGIVSLFQPEVIDVKPWQLHSPPFHHVSQTSQDAAFSLLPRHRTLQEKVLDAISEAVEGLTDEEIVQITELAPNTARPRRIELASPVHDKEGNLIRPALIESCGTRATKSGRQAQIWKVSHG